MRLKETIMIISFSLLLLKVKCTQAFLTVGVEAGWGVGGLRIRVARVEERGGRTGGAGAVETSGVVLARGIEVL